MNTFIEELHELIDKYRDMPGVALEELIDALDVVTAELVEEVAATISRAITVLTDDRI
jgi:hypothetical protein